MTDSGPRPAALEWLDGFGHRPERRPAPRLSGLLAGAGGTVVIIGAVSLLSTSEDPSLWPAFLVFVALATAGFGLVWQFRSGPLATAGATVSSITVPLAWTTLINGIIQDGRPTDSSEIILILSLVTWAVMFGLGPGRGRAVYVAFGVTYLGYYVADHIAGGLTSDGNLALGAGRIWGPVIVAAALYSLAWVLDRYDLAGVATAVVGPANIFAATAAILSFVTWLFGQATAADINGSVDVSDLAGNAASEMLLPAIAMTVGAIAVIQYGVSAGRRATAWTGAAASASGLTLFVFSVSDFSMTTFAIIGLVVGAALVAAAWWIAQRTGEADEYVDHAPAVALMDVIRGQARKVAAAAGNANRAPVPPPVTPAAPPVGPPVGMVPPPTPGATPLTAVPPPVPSPVPVTTELPRVAPTPAPEPAPAPTPPPAPAAAPLPDLPPAPGWWKASDGNWYSPEQQPGR